MDHRSSKAAVQDRAVAPAVLKPRSVVAHFIALRPQQWTKNLIIFAAPLFAFSVSVQTLLSSALAFALFCCVSSSFYLFNDVIDVKDDRRHPVKKNRPIAAGLVRVPIALFMATLLLSSAISISVMHSPYLGLIITSYAVLQLAYNFKLKRMVILDVIAIALGFVLRAFAGAAATQITLSLWFVLCTAMLALFLAIEKRKAELRSLQFKGGKTRSVLRLYTKELLDRMEGAVVAGAITAYSLWSAGPELRGASTSWMLVTLPFVLYGIFRYQLLSSVPETATSDDAGETTHQTERPERVLLNDLPILLTVAGWVLTIFVILLLKHQNIIH